MKNEALEAAFAALFISFADDSEYCSSVLNRFAEIFHVKDRLPCFIEKCKNLQSYVLEVFIGSHPVHVYIIESESCREQVLKPGVINKIDIGKSTDVSLKFSLKVETEKTSSMKIARSASLLKKVLFSEKKNLENIQVSQLPIGSKVKKNIHLGIGKTTVFDFKLVRNDNRHQIQNLDFEEFLEITQQIHEWQSSSNTTSSTVPYDGNLGNPTFSMFYSIAFFFEIPSFVLKVSEMITFLVWDIDDETRKLDDRAFFDVIEKMTACEMEVDLNHPLLVPSLIYLNDCTSTEIQSILQQFSNETLFPPISAQRLKPINDSLKMIGEICVLEIWEDFESLANPSTCLSMELKKLLRNSAQRWEQTVKYAGFMELYTKLRDLWTRLNEESKSYHIFFNQFDINYIEIALKTIETTVKRSVRRCLKEEVKSINTRNKDELEEFTRTTMRLFLILKNVCEMSQIDGEFARFEEWFDEICVFWTYSWRDVTRRMVERTISLDEDGDSVKYGARRPLPAGLYSFLCIQKGIADDMMRLEFRFSKHLMICSTSVVNIMCQNILAYAKKLFGEAIRHHDEKASRLIRASNGIEQALTFVEEGHQRFAQFDRLASVATGDDDDDATTDYEAVRVTSQRLLKCTRETCENQIDQLASQFVAMRRDAITRCAKMMCADVAGEINLTSYVREVTATERLDATLDVAYRLVDDVKCLLLPNCFKTCTKHISNTLETEVRQFLRQKQPPEYYSNIYIALKYIYEMLEVEDHKDIELLSSLHLNSFSTNDLILSYYDSLCEKIERSPLFGSMPTIDVHIVHSKIETDMEINIQIKLVKMSPMEWIDVLSERVDYFLRFDLLPKIQFPTDQFDSPTTMPVPQSTRPQWRQLFEIRVPLESFFTRGACLAISVFDHERFQDRLVGRAFIPLHSLPSRDDDDATPSRRHALLPADFQEDDNNTFFRLLRSRASQDPIAKQFIETRTRRCFGGVGDIRRYIRRRNRSRVGAQIE